MPPSTSARHALHYGSSVFEGERVYATPQGPAYFRLADHTARLFESASVYDIEIGYSQDADQRRLPAS